MSIPDENIILEGSLKRCKKYKLFKTKWVEHYFVLYCRDRARNLYAIDEFKSSRRNELKKSFKLEFVIRVESNLSISDPTILCNAAGHHRQTDKLHSIFGIAFRFQNLVKELYLVAKNDEEMALWVNEICKLCKLHRQNDEEGDNSHAAESSISGMSIRRQHSSVRKASVTAQRIEPSEKRPARKYSSLPSTPSEDKQNIILIYKTPVDSVPDQNKYHRMHHFKSVNSHQSLPSNPNYNNLPEPLESRSETSSMYSSRRTEDDSVSYTSGPPIPPPRTKHVTNRFVKVYQNGQVGRLHMIPASTSMGPVIRVEDAEESSGETLKHGTNNRYPESVASSEGISIYERNGKTLIRRAPPPVDRSNKPKNMRGEEDGTRYRNLSKHGGNGGNGGNENSSYSANYSNKYTTYISEASKRRNLDYFEPTQLVENSSSSTMAATSTRSPTPSDIEYITVDVDRTLAFKQMR
ncbi:CBN-SOC-1 protein, partial [Caenorhabditis brenneri]